jgi:hypothetical protein
MGKPLVEDSWRLEAGYFQWNGYLSGELQRGALTVPTGGDSSGAIGWSATPDAVLVYYTITAGDAPAETLYYTIPVSYTPLPTGGRRAWWQCPTCARRCGVLYLPWRIGARRFACRQCHHLGYRGQCDRDWVKDPSVRELRRLERLHRLLSHPPAILAPFPETLPPPPPAPPPRARRGRPRLKRKYTRRAPLAAP